MFFNVIKLIQHGYQQLLIVIDKEGHPSITIYNEHEGQTIMRMCEPTLENLQRAVDILNGKESGEI